MNLETINEFLPKERRLVKHVNKESGIIVS
jgi:hypothetical protein